MYAGPCSLLEEEPALRARWATLRVVAVIPWWYCGFAKHRSLRILEWVIPFKGRIRLLSRTKQVVQADLVLAARSGMLEKSRRRWRRYTPSFQQGQPDWDALHWDCACTASAVAAVVAHI